MTSDRLKAKGKIISCVELTEVHSDKLASRAPVVLAGLLARCFKECCENSRVRNAHPELLQTNRHP